jgi:hypothetical protein
MIAFDSTTWAALGVYLVVEALFCASYYLYLVPRANKRTKASPYRDYGPDRLRLLFRILDRSAALSIAKGIDPRQGMREYILACFAKGAPPPNGTEPTMFGVATEQTASTNKAVPLESFLQMNSTASFKAPPLLRLSRESMSFSSTSDYDDASTDDSTDDETDIYVSRSSQQHSPQSLWTVEGVGKDDIDKLICWALFGKHHEEFEPWELEKKRDAYEAIEKRYGLVFAPGSNNCLKPRQLNLEDVEPMNRPLLVYIAIMLVKTLLVGIILRLAGYQRVVSTKGLVAWYRPPAAPFTTKRSCDDQQEQSSLLPLLFFHGIAPGGLALYLPMILCGIGCDGRAVFLFENPNISGLPTFKVLNEQETANGAVEIVDRFLPREQGLSLCGHSFGSCTLTWLLHTPALRHRIKQITLLDPAAILLSEPDVMVNFLYCKEVNKIRMIAGSELFTQYFLRRHFFFYNSELWLDDIPDDVHTLVALSENDAIVNAPRAKEYVDCFGKNNSASLKQIYWHGVGHGKCVSSPQRWREIKQAMLHQELAIAQESRL